VKRLPALAFGGLVVATVFAFFLTQILKTANPLVHGNPAPIPAAFNPVHGRVCPSKTRNRLTHRRNLLNYRRTSLAIKLYHPGTVAVNVVDNAGDPIATISEGRTLGPGQLSVFIWKGFENGGRYAPDGTYFFELSLVHQGRTIDLSQSPITVITHDPHAPATSVKLTSAGTSSAKINDPVVLTPPAGSVTAHFKGGGYRRVWIDIYRSDATGPLKLVYRFAVKPTQDSAVWAGNLADGVPAPAGTYLIGISVQDPACNPGVYPVTRKPSPGTTPDAGVTVRYLAATPPLTPTPAGSRATVEVDSPTGSYTWALRLAGKGKVLARGEGGSAGTGAGTLVVRVPRGNAALYKLTLSAGQYSAAVPLVASATGARAARGRVLVVLPMLTWQGENPVDDTGDGLPDTLTDGDEISLDRPLAEGLPMGFRQDASLITFLNSQHLHFQLTTDVALAEDVGPSLVDRWGVVLAGSESWLPESLVSGVNGLEGFVQGGGRVLSLGTDSLTASSRISGYPTDPVASAPTKMTADLFGAKHGPLTRSRGDLITELEDQLDILSAAPALSGFSTFEPIEPPAGAKASLAGITDDEPALTAFQLGKGYVVEIGLSDFNTTLATNVDSQDLLNRIWQLLAK
jgi:hypothetical protein